MPNRPPNFATATRSSNATRFMSQSASRARHSIRWRRCRKSSARVGGCLASSMWSAVRSHANADAAFTCTAVAFVLLAIHLGRIRDLSTADGSRLLAGLAALPEQIDGIIAREAEIARLAEQLVASEHAYFVGRSAGYAVAMEGALKLKEVSYLHAEAYSAAELKHGPLALISPETPTMAVIPRDHLYRKNISTVEEIRARRGPVFAVTHAGEIPIAVDGAFDVPASEPELDPILFNIPLQLLAYHVALTKGCDIDKPRNLAKSVTVE